MDAALVTGGTGFVGSHVVRLLLNDRYARLEWGWKHAFDLAQIIDSFMKTGKGV